MVDAGGRPEPRWWTVGVAGGTVIVMALRLPIAMRQLWAEDGSVYLQDALRDGPFRPFGSTYAGYFQLTNRVIGGVASELPLRWAATVTWVLVAVVIAWCAATVFTVGQAWIRSPWARATLAVGLVLLPAVGGESIGTAASLQFPLLFAALVVLIGSQTWSARTVNGCALVVVMGLTAALGVVLAPLAIWRVVRIRRVDPVTVAWAAAVAVQLVVLALARDERDSSSSLRQAPGIFVDALGGPVLVATAICLIIAGLWLAWQWGHRFLAALLIMVPGIGAAVFVVSAARNTGGLTPRYWMVPAWCVVWAALVSVQLLSDRIGPRAQAAVPVACVALVAFWLVGWSPSPWRSVGVSWGSTLDGIASPCGDEATVSIMPTVKAPAIVWTVQVPCDRL